MLGIINRIISIVMSMICVILSLFGIKSAEKTEKLVFSAIGNNNEYIWGVKK